MTTRKPVRKISNKDDKWYDIEKIVEILIHETPKGEKYAPEIGNLCIGFTSLTLDKLGEEINDIRAYWPFIFPRGMQTEELLKLVQDKYQGYEEIMALREVV